MRNEVDLRAGFAWGCVGALVCGIAIPLEPSMLEEGILLHVAERLVQGERLYQDVLVFTGPLPFELLAQLFRIFGEEVWVGRATVLLLHGLSTGLVHALARRAGAGPLAHAAAAVFASAPVLLFPLYSLYYYTTLALHLSVIATYAAARGLESRGWALAAGAAAAGTALCKQSVGLVLIVGLGLALASARPRGRRVAGGLEFAGGGIAIGLLTLGAFAAAGGLTELVRGVLILPLSLEDTYTSPYLNLWPVGRFGAALEGAQRFYLPSLYTLLTPGSAVPASWVVAATQLLYALPLLAVAAPVTAAVLHRRPSPVSWLHFALLLAWVSNLFPRTDWGHLAHVLPFALVQLVLVVAGVREGSGLRPRGRGALAAALVVLAGASIAAGLALLGISESPSYGPRVPLRPASQLARSSAAAGVIAYLRERVEPDESIFVARAEPLLYFATDTRNPTPFPGVIPGWRKEQEAAVLAGLQGVRYVVMSDVDQPAMTYYRDQLPAVQAYFERYFRVPASFTSGPIQWLTVLERGEDRGETAIDLFERLPESRAFVRDGDGDEAPSPVLSQRVATQYNRRPLAFSVGAGGGGLDFELQLPRAAVFQGSVGLRRVTLEGRTLRHPPQSSLRVWLKGASHDADFQLLDETPAMDAYRPGKRWTELEVDLGAHAGERVVLRLDLVSRDALRGVSIGWWGSPRIVQRQLAARATTAIEGSSAEEGPRSLAQDLARQPDDSQ